jgi:hypothetical protein
VLRFVFRPLLRSFCFQFCARTGALSSAQMTLCCGYPVGKHGILLASAGREILNFYALVRAYKKKRALL